MKKTMTKLNLKRETIRILRDLHCVRGARNNISEVIGGCTPGTTGNDTDTEIGCRPGPASVHNNCAR